MRTLKSFFEPIVIRWRQRRACFSCGGPATLACRTHGTKLCGSAFCKMEHRRHRGAVSGSLTRPFCDYVALNTWFDYVIRGVAMFVTAAAFIWFFVLMGVL